MSSTVTRRKDTGRPGNGGKFDHVAGARSTAALDGPQQAADGPVPPPGDGWMEIRYPACISWQREFAVEGGTATHSVDVYDNPAPRPGSERVQIGGGGITIAAGDRLPGELHYNVVLAPLLDEDGAETGRTVKAVNVNWVEVKGGRNGGRGKGWASAMYAAIRAAHPDAIIPAADCLEPPGRRLVKHYRDKYPEVHTGRFDTRGRIHPTRGGDDPAYRAELLEAPEDRGSL